MQQQRAVIARLICEGICSYVFVMNEAGVRVVVDVRSCRTGTERTNFTTAISVVNETAVRALEYLGSLFGTSGSIKNVAPIIQYMASTCEERKRFGVLQLGGEKKGCHTPMSETLVTPAMPMVHTSSFLNRKASAIRRRHGCRAAAHLMSSSIWLTPAPPALPRAYMFKMLLNYIGGSSQKRTAMGGRSSGGG